MIGAIFKFLLGGPLDRALSSVDKYVGAQTDREKIKGEIVMSHYKHRGEFMRAGGFWLMMLFAVPIAFHYMAVTFYSVFWCADCAFAQSWTVAALPPSFQADRKFIIMSIFGVIGVSRWRR